jgi:UDP-N-acetylglucosamine 2-epimerase (hydrolysing)
MELRKKKILFVTGTRADYGKLKPLMHEVENSTDLECHIFATGMHLISRYGLTVSEIYKSGFQHVFPYINQDSSLHSRMDLALANTIQGIAHYVRELLPDLIVVHGDRIEALAGAAVGALGNVLVAHIEGGEVSGTADELIRHAVTKLSHLHFVANEECAERLAQMGENESSIFVIGSPDIDVMLSESLPALDRVRARYDIPFDAYGIFLYHPVTTEPESLRTNLESVLGALEASGKCFVVIYPNNDHGSEVIVEAYERLRENPRFRVLPSMRFEYFLSLLKHAELIAGNSSAGIREAPVYGIPTINIGTRQRDRFRHDSIWDAPEEKDAIRDALLQPPPRVRSWKFGSGDSARRFIRCLTGSALWQTPKQKQFCDLPAVSALARTGGV